MAWHLNLDLGTHYSRRKRVQRDSYQNVFGITINGIQRDLCNFRFDLSEMEQGGVILIESPGYYRIHIWYENGRFYVAPTRDSTRRRFLNARHP